MPRADIEAIIGTAQKVPSWCNAQPWNITLVSGAETALFRAALQQEVATGAPKSDLAFPAKYDGVYKERRRSCGWQLYDAVGVEKGDLMVQQFSAADLEAQRAVNDVFDPGWLLNPAKVFPRAASEGRRTE